MPMLTENDPKAVKDLALMWFRRTFHDSSEHEEVFHWKDGTYYGWILELESLRPVIKYFGNENDAFNFCNCEHFEELRQAVMLEF